MTVTSYQTVGFHFKVVFEGLPDVKSEPVPEGGDASASQGIPKNIDVCFQSVSGLDVQFTTDSLKEGGENRFTHELPGRSQYSSSLVLKRGLVKPEKSGITIWCTKAFVNLEIQPLNLSVELLDPEHKPLAKWDVIHAWPKSWKIGELNAERSEVLIETLELNYNRFAYKKT